MRIGPSFGRLAVRTLSLAFPLYLASLVLALVPALVGMAGIVAVAGDRPWRTELLGPNWLNLLLEVLGGAVYQGGSAGLTLMLVAGLLLTPLALFAQLVAYSFLAGGILAGLALGQSGGRYFLASCRRWFWPSLQLSLFGSAVVASVGILLGMALALAVRWVSADVTAILQLAVQAMLLGWVELARAVMVGEGSKSVGRALIRALRAFTQPWVPIVWLLLALPPLSLILAAVGPPAVSDAYSVGDLLVVLGYGQLVAFAMAWTKVIRLAVAVRLLDRLALKGHDRAASSVGGF